MYFSVKLLAHIIYKVEFGKSQWVCMAISTFYVCVFSWLSANDAR